MLLSSRLRMTLGDTGSRDSMAWPYALVVDSSEPADAAIFGTVNRVRLLCGIVHVG